MTVGHLFSRATNFTNGGSYFHESILVSSLQSAICVTIEFPLIFGEIKFVEVPKIHEIGILRKKAPYVMNKNVCDRACKSQPCEYKLPNYIFANMLYNLQF